MYKIVAFDLDETLFNDDHVICKRNIDAIRKGLDMGVKMVPCSGRGIGCLGSLLSDLNIETKDQFSILGNGAIVVNNTNDHILHCDQVEFNIVKKLIEFASKIGINVQVFTPDELFLYFTDEEEKQRAIAFHCEDGPTKLSFVDHLDTDILKDKIVYKILFQKPDMDYLKGVAKEIEAFSENKLTITFSSNRYIEINSFGTTKGGGLKLLSKHLGVNISETVGIGDNFNDFALVAEAGLGCVVKNAVTPLKEIATYICDADNNEGGVAEVIEKFIINNN